MDWRGTHQRDSSGERVLDRDESQVAPKITALDRRTVFRDKNHVTPKITSLHRGDQEN
jgi:hypothetical protein